MGLRLELAGYRRNRGSVIGSVRAVNDGGMVFADGVNLSSSKSRTYFITQLQARLNGSCPAAAALEQELLRLLAWAEEQLADDPAPEAPAAAEEEERVEDYIKSPRGYELVRVREVAGEARETRKKLSNFTAAIIEDITVDDGSGEGRRSFVLEGRLADRTLPPARIDAAQFPSLDRWVMDAWGVDARVAPGNVRDHLRDCIQAFSWGARRRTVFGHTGVRHVGGDLLFLHAGGAIGKDGSVDGVEVELDGKLAGYRLPDPPDGTRLRDAVRVSWDAWDVAVPTVAAPVKGVVYAAPLADWLRPDFSAWLRGRSGLLKSSYTAAELCHYGLWDWKTAPANWEATANWLEKAAFWIKDLPFLVDDYRPPADRHEAGEMRRKAARLLRAAGNRSGRGRMRSDTTLRPELYPRGIVIVTAEEQAPGESTAARLWDIPVTDGAIDSVRLDALKGSGDALGLAAAGYVRYLMGRLELGAAWLHELFATARDRARLVGGHLRHPQTFAHLLTGWLVFAEFAQTVGAVSPQEAKERLGEVVGALRAVAELQAENARRVRPDLIFISTLGDLFAGWRAHLCSLDGKVPSHADNPDDGTLWGWQITPNDENPEWTKTIPHGDKVGWVDGECLYLIPTAAHRLVAKTVVDRGESFLISPHALNEALERGGFLVRGSKGLRHNQWAEGRQHDVIRLDRTAVLAAWGTHTTT